MAAPALELIECPHVAVYRVVERTLRADPTLNRVVRTWWTWNGSEEDLGEPTADTCPSIALAPRIGGDEFRGPASFEAPLRVRLAVCTAGTRSADLLNLLWAIKRALYPRADADRVAIRRALVAAGAITGEPSFPQSSYGVDDAADPSMLMADAEIRLDVDELLNP